MDKYNKYTLLVLNELQHDPFFYRENHLIEYFIPKEGEKPDLTHVSKINAVKDLNDLGAIKIYEEQVYFEESLPKIFHYESYIVINHPAFNHIYKKCFQIVTGKNLEEQEEKNLNTKKKTALKQEI